MSEYVYALETYVYTFGLERAAVIVVDVVELSICAMPGVRCLG
jgi:hypothetical protein